MDATATFEDFYGANRDRVFRTVALALPGDADAAEATAEAFVRAFTRWRSVSRHPNPVGWVVKTAINQISAFATTAPMAPIGTASAHNNSTRRFVLKSARTSECPGYPRTTT